MKRSLKTLAACAAFTICMCATTIISFAATDLKLDPVALLAYSQDASTEDGVSITGSELFIGLDTGSYTFADVAESLNDYGLSYEVTDDAYIIGSAVEIGTAGAFTDALAADASYKYNIVSDGYQAVVVTIAAKNAEEVASVVVAGVSDVAENGLPDEVTDAITDIYSGIADAVPDIVDTIQEEAPGIISGIVDTVTEGYSDVIDQATEALSNVSPEDVQDFVDNAVSDIADTVGGVIDDVAGAIGDAAPDFNLDDLWAFLFS